jgi:hypothetical protein
MLKTRHREPESDLGARGSGLGAGVRSRSLQAGATVCVRILFAASALLLVPSLALAQIPGGSPYTIGICDQHRRVDGIVVRAAEKVSEELLNTTATR